MKIKYKMFSTLGTVTLISLALLAFVTIKVVKIRTESFIYENMDTVREITHEMIKTGVEASVKNYLRATAEKELDTVKYQYSLYKRGLISERLAKQRCEELMLSKTIGKTGYIYVANTQGTMLIHPVPSLIGKDVGDDDIFKKQVKIKNGYMEYKWLKPGETVEREKSVYMVYFKEWDWMISASAYKEEFIYLTDIVNLEKQIKNIKIGKTGYIYIIDSQGNIILHPELAAGTNIYGMTDIKNNYVIQQICEKKDGNLQYVFKEEGKKLPRTKISFFTYYPLLDWIIVSSTYKDELYSLLTVLTSRIIGLVLVIIVLLLISILIFNTIILGPIAKISKSLKVLASGKGDLTRRLEIKSRDEVSELAESFNQFMASLNVMLKNIKSSFDDTQIISNKLLSSNTEMLEQSEQLKNSISNINSSTESLNEEINKSGTLSKQVKNHINIVSDLMISQSTNINESSSSIEEMSASIMNIAKNSENKLTIVNELRNKAHNGEILMNDTISIIGKINESTNTITEILEVIDTISNQTDLLAMNAAIEAAHAGEAGKGFAVVADEIRNLAESSGENSRSIHETLNEILNSIQSSETSSTKTGEIFKEIVRDIKDVSISLEEIKQGMTEMSLGSEQIFQALSTLLELTKNMNLSKDEMQSGIESIDLSLIHINQMSGTNSSHMNEINQKINGFNTLIKSVLENVKLNQKNIDEIIEQVNQFKTE